VSKAEVSGIDALSGGDYDKTDCGGHVEEGGYGGDDDT
jgi:paraquat-inducible protein B